MVMSFGVVFILGLNAHNHEKVGLISGVSSTVSSIAISVVISTVESDQ
jgi:hypothetical protein